MSSVLLQCGNLKPAIILVVELAPSQSVIVVRRRCLMAREKRIMLKSRSKDDKLSNATHYRPPQAISILLFTAAPPKLTTSCE